MLREFRLLGPVEVHAAGHLVPIGHSRQRAVLAVLLLDANQSVPIGQLIDRVWGEHAPATARQTLYSYLSLLGRSLEMKDADRAILRDKVGYLVKVKPDAFDLLHFRRLAARAVATDDLEIRADMLRQALGLWHGVALADVDSPWLARIRSALESERMNCLLACNNTDLELGRHADLLGPLHEVTARHPHEEPLAAQLITALYRCGRQADALGHYQRIRAQLREDLGIDPSPQLRELYQRILRNDADLAAPTLTMPSDEVQILPLLPRADRFTDAEFTALQAQVQAYQVQLEKLRAELQALRAQLSQNSRDLLAAVTAVD